jgi:hypothetical protein
MSRTTKAKTTASFSLRHQLVKRIAELAAEESRSKFNVADLLLERAIKESEKERQTGTTQ